MTQKKVREKHKGETTTELPLEYCVLHCGTKNLRTAAVVPKHAQTDKLFRRDTSRNEVAYGIANIEWGRENVRLLLTCMANLEFSKSPEGAPATHVKG